MVNFKNPFRPGAGHAPPFLAGREKEKEAFGTLLEQDLILKNMLLTGLRGVGKTVLLDAFKPMAIAADWFWAGTDLSEAVSVSELTLAIRIMTDLASVTSAITFIEAESAKFGTPATCEAKLSYETLLAIFEGTPGLVSDKLKRVLEIAWACIKSQMPNVKGIVFAYDEAQNMSDHAEKEQYPLSLLLDVFQSIQRKGLPLMLALTGLPTLQTRLVETRTYTERMFETTLIGRLREAHAREAIQKPLKDYPLKLDGTSLRLVLELTAGYPYFIQFVCREVYDTFIQLSNKGQIPRVPTDEITRKLDQDFFAGRWGKATDRQRQILAVTAQLEGEDEREFTVQEIVTLGKKLLEKPISSSHVNQMLASLTEAGLVYKNRHGKYLFAVPLLGKFINRQKVSMASLA